MTDDWGQDRCCLFKNGCRDRVQFALFGRRLEDEFGYFVGVGWAKV